MGDDERSRRTVILGFADQAVLSIGSILYLLAAAQHLAPRALGEFSISAASILLVLSIVRAIGGETLLVREGRLNHTAGGAAMLGVSLLLSLTASLVFLIIALLWPTYSYIYIGAAVAVPSIVLQDAVRYIWISAGVAPRLLVIDSLTVAANVVGIYSMGYAFQSPSLMIVAWGGSCFISSIVSMFIFGQWLSFKACWSWLRRGWRYSSAYATEAILGATVGYVTVIVISIFASPSDVAALRAVVSVFGLTSLVINFMRSTVLRELSRSALDKSRVMKIEVTLTSITLAIVLATLAVLWLLPNNIGLAALGDTWFLVLPLLVPAAINRAVASISAIPTVLLRSIGVTWEATRVRVLIASSAMALGPVGAYLGGAVGALLAESLTYGLLVLFLTLLLHRRIKRGPI